MKNFAKIVVACIALLLCSCDGDRNNPDKTVPYIKYGWDNFPFERVDCYFPEEGTELVYVSDKGNTFTLTIEEISREYEPRPERDPIEEAFGGFTTASEIYFITAKLTNNANEDIVTPRFFDMYIGDSRKYLSIGLTTTQNLEFDFTAENKSSKPDAIFQYLGDTIFLKASHWDKFDNKTIIPNAAKIVKGKGIVMYKTIITDTIAERGGEFIGMGETWTLVE